MSRKRKYNDLYNDIKENPVNINNRCTDYNSTCINWAVWRNDIDRFNNLIKIDNIDVNSPDRIGYTPLISSCLKGSPLMVKKLIEINADVNLIGGRKKNTPLMESVYFGKHNSTQILMDLGADPNLMNKGQLPLINACRSGSINSINILLNYPQTDLDIVDKYNRHAYKNAANKKIKKMLINTQNKKIDKLMNILYETLYEYDSLHIGILKIIIEYTFEDFSKKKINF